MTSAGELSAPLRLLVLDHTAELGGAELALLRLLDAVDSELIDARVVLFAGGPLVARLRKAGVPTRVLPMPSAVGTMTRNRTASIPALASAVRLIPFLARLGWAIRRLKPDVVYTTSLKSDLLGLVAARLARRPIVWHIHDRVAEDYLPRATVAVVRSLARLPDGLVANSSATAATLGGRVPVIVYPGFAPDQAAPLDGLTRQNAGSPSPQPTIGLLGRVSPTKGQLEFVRAAARVLERYPSVKFRIIGAATFGDEQYARSVQAEAHRLGIADHIEWAGFAEDTARAIDELDVLVHASPAPEPFGQVIVEAMIRGVPVVATDGGGVSEILCPTDIPPLGLLATPGSATDLAEKMLAVLDDPVAAAQRADAAHHRAALIFPVSRTASDLTRVWLAACRDAVRSS